MPPLVVTNRHTHTQGKRFFSFGRKKVWFFLSFALSPVSASVFVDFIFGLVLFPLERLISFAEFEKREKLFLRIHFRLSESGVGGDGGVGAANASQKEKEREKRFCGPHWNLITKVWHWVSSDTERTRIYIEWISFFSFFFCVVVCVGPVFDSRLGIHGLYLHCHHIHCYQKP